jgi:hypothetical protein
MLDYGSRVVLEESPQKRNGVRTRDAPAFFPHPDGRRGEAESAGLGPFRGNVGKTVLTSPSN